MNLDVKRALLKVGGACLGRLSPRWCSRRPLAQKVPLAGGGALGHTSCWQDKRRHPRICARGAMGAGATPHWLSPIPAGSYLQLQPGGGLCAHPVGIGASQALSIEGPVASWSFTNEVQQILVGEEGKGRKTLRMENPFYLLLRWILKSITLIVTMWGNGCVN